MAIFRSILEDCMTSDNNIIQALSVAVAPVFMLTGIGVIMSSINTRFGRIVDRIRTLLREGKTLYKQQIGSTHVASEIKALFKRAKLLRGCLILLTISVFFVAFTVFLIFVELILDFDVPYLVAISFCASLIPIIIAMILYTQDLAISLRTIDADIKVRGNRAVLKELAEED